METDQRRDSVEPTDSVHVRTLGVGDTFRWSWEALTDRLELVGFALLVSLLSVVVSFGVSPTAITEMPEFDAWVWPLFLVYVLAIPVVWGVAYTSAEDAVANRKRPIRDHIVAVAKRVPALIAAAIPMWILTTLGLLVLFLPGIYLFHRLVLAYPACVIDGKGPFASLKAGWRASSGNVFKLLGVSLVYAAALGVSNYAVGVVGPLAGGLVSAGLSAVLLPVFGLALGHLYLESSRNR
ncbi:hypothetical protein [Halorussus pelagicus]|uniref:hypothetical protein n=1 Tax=Halorussus pelagicus TaxID=2505977 RepID=UPI000FFC1AFD|nr:hypothetical protein [Halorussus pelagicus]